MRVVGLVAVKLDRTPPSGTRRERTAGIPRTRGWRASMLLTLAAEIAQVSGRPWLSRNRWSLEPGLPRSVGCGPAFFPFLGADRPGVDGGADQYTAGSVCPARPGRLGGCRATGPSGARAETSGGRWRGWLFSVAGIGGIGGVGGAGTGAGVWGWSRCGGRGLVGVWGGWLGFRVPFPCRAIVAVCASRVKVRHGGWAFGPGGVPP